MKNQTPGPRAPSVAIVVSRYNHSITGAMLDAAVKTYTQAAGDAENLEVFEAPGSFELPTLALHAAMTERFDGVLVLGCLIKGQTIHDRVIADAVARGIIDVTLRTGVPVAFGVLTVDTVQQARDRSGGAEGNKGEEAMSALLETIDSIASIWTGNAPEPARSGAPKARPDKAAASKPVAKSRRKA